MKEQERENTFFFQKIFCLAHSKPSKTLEEREKKREKAL